MHLNLLEEEVQHNDEHDINLYFCPSNSHTSEYSILNNSFHEFLCDLTFDVSMIFLDGSSPFVPLLDYNLKNYIHPLSMDFSSLSIVPSHILSDAPFYFYCIDKVESSILTSFINNLEKDDYAFLSLSS